MRGARGPFPPAAAMVVVVVTPVVFCNKATETFNKKLVVCNQCLSVLIYIVKHILIPVPLIVGWTEPELYAGRSPNHFGPMDPSILDHGQLGMALAFPPLLFSVQSYGLYVI
jgi:hypothetical protein